MSSAAGGRGRGGGGAKKLAHTGIKDKIQFSLTLMHWSTVCYSSVFCPASRWQPLSPVVALTVRGWARDYQQVNTEDLSSSGAGSWKRWMNIHDDNAYLCRDVKLVSWADVALLTKKKKKGCDFVPRHHNFTLAFNGKKNLNRTRPVPSSDCNKELPTFFDCSPTVGS